MLFALVLPLELAMLVWDNVTYITNAVAQFPIRRLR